MLRVYGLGKGDLMVDGSKAKIIESSFSVIFLRHLPCGMDVVNAVNGWMEE